MNIFVSNLGFNVQGEELRKIFTPYGEVISSKIISDRESGKSRGFGFIEMSDDTVAAKAIAELDGAIVEGRAIQVAEARPKSNGSGNSNKFRDNREGDRFNNHNSYNQNHY